MTCIVGLVSDNSVYIGGDSAGINGHSLTVRADEKVFVNNGFVFGFTSSFRMGQILRFGFSPPKRHYDIDLYEYMVTEFVDAVRRRFHDAGFLRIDNSVEEGGTFLVGHEGRLFEINDDFQVGEALSGYNAVGCGHEIALGALYAIQKTGGIGDPEQAVLYALEASESHSAGVRRPFAIHSVSNSGE